MELKLKRIALRDTYTIGELYVDNHLFCNTIEDKVRDFTKEGKVYGRTAIPYGRYEITMKVQSPKFSKYQFYRDVCNGYLPRLLNVRHFDGILLHVADGYKGADLLSGCIGVGDNKIKGGLLNGRQTFINLYKTLKEADNRGEKIWIQIE